MFTATSLGPKQTLIKGSATVPSLRQQQELSRTREELLSFDKSFHPWKHPGIEASREIQKGIALVINRRQQEPVWSGFK